MLGLAHTLYVEELHDKVFLAQYCVGFERFSAYLTGETDGQPKTADWAAEISGITAESIRALARKMAAKRTMITIAYSLQRGDHGEQSYWMVATLAAMLREIGLPGGGCGFGYGSMNGYGNPTMRVPSPNMPTGENPVRDFIPVARIADLLLNPGGAYQFNGEERTYPDIRLVYWCGGNPFHHHQDLNRLVEAWRRPDTIIVNEPWWTSTARFADIVLPATTTMERNDIGASSRDRYWIAMQQAVEPVAQSRNDYDIFSAFARKMGVEDEFTEGRDEDGWMRHLYDVARQQAARRRSNYQILKIFGHKATRKALSLKNRSSFCPNFAMTKRQTLSIRRRVRSRFFREDRRFRIRRLPGSSNLDGTVRMARCAGRENLPLTPDFQPTEDSPAWSTRPRLCQPEQ